LYAKAALARRNNKAVAALSPWAIVRGNPRVPGLIAYTAGIVYSPLCRPGPVISGLFYCRLKSHVSPECAVVLGGVMMAATQLVVVTAGQDGLSLKNTVNFSLKIDFPLPDG